MAPTVSPLTLHLTPTDEELNRRLEEKLNVFRNAGLRLQHLTINDFVQIFLPFKDVLKILRFLESFITQGILLPLISQAQHHSILLPKPSLEANDLYTLSEWLKTPQGSLVIRQMQTERRLLKKSAVQCSARDIAYTRLLSHQQADLSYELKEIRTRGELNAQNKRVEKMGEKEEAKIKDEYSAAANFPDSSNNRLQELCWSKYLDKCTAEGSAPITRTDDALRMVTEAYRREIAQTIVVEYCDDVKVRRQLVAYGKRKIEFLKTAGKRKRELERFCDVVAIAAGSTDDEDDGLDPI